MDIREKKLPLIILTGPTAVGKTKTSIGLARAVGGEIVSADSMQVYRHMDIGSAKIRSEEMKGIPHYLIDVLEPDDEFHAARFQMLAKEAMKEIYAAGHIPIITGGTGFYIQALLYDIDFSKGEEDAAYRRKMNEYADVHGNHALHELLLGVDEASAISIHENNRKRVIRALEFYHRTGIPISAHNQEERRKESPYNFAYFVLNDLRSHLYERIDHRVDEMLQAGLVSEVQRLKSMGYSRNLVSMQGLGYKEIYAYLDGEVTLDEAVYTIKRDTRHFAKRQLTWFKRERDVIWIQKEQYNYGEPAILEAIVDSLQEKEIMTNEA